MLRAGVDHDWFVVARRVGQVMLVDQDRVAVAIGEDRGPAVAVDDMDSALFSDLERVP